ncbi:MAG: hypothetical protein ACI9X0_002925 [Kiritimatiellia bacterium]|jgi:hypothetical protein
MLKSADKWMLGYVQSVLRRPRVAGPKHLIVCVADHYEPFQGEQDLGFALAQVKRWQDALPGVSVGAKDSGGYAPRHSFFYPQEEYHPEVLARVADLCHAGLGETEIHLHHDNDTPEGLRQKLIAFRDVLHRDHGLLGVDAQGDVRYAFIHGNWALCNSRPDGRHCGVDAELSILQETGCHVDMTFPSAPSPTQPRLVNGIYYAQDRTRGPRSADDGVLVRAGQPAAPGLLMLQGPLALNWGWRKFGILPRLENGELTAINPPTSNRLALWARQHIHVPGRPEWVFVKLHTHGCDARHIEGLLSTGLPQLHKLLAEHVTEKRGWAFHYASAREMANMVRAAESGAGGDPSNYRDFAVKAPA